MDLNTTETICLPLSRGDLPDWQHGDAFLAGGSWLFSEPQPQLRRLIDLANLRWEPLTLSDSGLSIAATCTIAQLDRIVLAPEYLAAPLIGQCCRALLGSFKVWNVATVGGNLCLALPAGPMIALAVAMDAVCTIWMADGAERRLSAIDFIRGPGRNALRSGEILRNIDIPAEALRRRFAFRRISLSPGGRSGALVIGTATTETLVLTLTAATRRPMQIAVHVDASSHDLTQALDAGIQQDDWFDDVHGAPDWRAHVTEVLAEEVRRELYSGGTR